MNIPLQRKLGRPTDQRKALLKGLVTSLFQNGRIITTEARAKEVKNIAEKILTFAIREVDNVTKSKEIKVSSAKLDSKGKKILSSATSKNGNKYDKVEREIKLVLVTSDMPSRLSARKKIMNWTYRIKDEDGKAINITNKIFDEIAPKYKDRNGGYTRVLKLGPRRGDAAEMAIVELV